MASRFKFRLLSDNPQEQYDAISPKDAYTFYLLTTGVGYLGEVPLFGGGTQNTIVKINEGLETPEQGKLYVLNNVTYNTNTLTGLYFYDGTDMSCFSEELISRYLTNILVTDMLNENFAGDDKTIATTKAIMDLINARLGDSEIIGTSFFRKVTNHTIIGDDLSNPNMSLPSDVQVGDIGLLFTTDTDDEDNGNEKFLFVSLSDYLTNVYGAADSSSVSMELTSDSKFKASLKIKDGEHSIKVDEENGGVYIEKVETVNDGTTEEPSPDKLMTEQSFVKYIVDVVLPKVSDMIDVALEDVVTAVIEPNVDDNGDGA